MKGANTYHIALLFISGADDHVAFAVAKCMADHPIVGLAVVWLRSEGNLHHNDPYAQDNGWLDPAGKVIRDFQFKSKGNDRITLSIQNADLLIVGRYHEPACPAIIGINLWSEYAELGMLGDMLVTTLDFQSSFSCAATATSQ
ncbi:hypothetical protein Ancab_011709 [Ancistrocladus abbreviatus]